MAEDLLEHYTAEQLRCHWLSLGLDQKAVSFAPKAFDTSVSHKDKRTGKDVLVRDDPRVVDPALKESAFLTNIFNRLARSCLYGAGNIGGHLPSVDATDVARAAAADATLAFERAAYEFNAHEALAVVERYAREANRRWGDESKATRDDDAAYEQALANAFCALRTVTLLMHAAVPDGCEDICRRMGFDPAAFFSWEHALATPADLATLSGESPTEHAIPTLPPRYDFFEKHPSQR